MTDQPDAYRNPPSHADILRAVHEVGRNVRINGRKLDALSRHLGIVDFSSEDEAVRDAAVDVQDALNKINPPGQTKPIEKEP